MATARIRLAQPLVVGSHSMMPGAKARSQFVRKRFKDIVALHRLLRASDPEVVIVLLASAQQPVAPAKAVANSDDGETLLAWLPLAEARSWLADADGIAKWNRPATDSMDVAVVAAGGVSVMRLSAR